MKTLTKQDTAKAVADATGITEEQATEAVRVVLDSMERTLSTGGRVEFRGFGVWEVHMRKARLGWRFPNRYQTKKEVKVKAIKLPAKPVVKFWYTSKQDLSCSPS